MASATQFFYAQAGYGYDPKVETRTQGRWRGARALAKAEAYAALQEWCFCWEWDEVVSLADINHDEWCAPKCGKAHEVLTCAVKNIHGNVLASLCGIVDPSLQYCRVIEAELALEAMPQ